MPPAESWLGRPSWSTARTHRAVWQLSLAGDRALPVYGAFSDGRGRAEGAITRRAVSLRG